MACRNGQSIGAAPQPERRDVAPTHRAELPPTEATAHRPAIDVLPPAGSSGAPRDTKTRTPSKLAAAEGDSLLCGGDADCTITCRTDGSCCLEQCGCSLPMSRAFLERLETHLARECGPNPLCPVAGCVGVKLYEPRCQKGLCVALKLEGGV